MIITENVLKSSLRQLKFPVVKRQKLQTESWADLDKVKTLSEKMKTEVNAKIGDLEKRFVSHLESRLVRERFHKLDIPSLSVEEKAAFDAENVKQFVDIKLGQIAEHFLVTSEFQKWANTTLKKDVTEARELLNATSLRIHGSNACNRAAVPSVVETIHALKTFGITVTAGAVVGAITGALIGQFPFGIEIAGTMVASATVVGAVGATVAIPVGPFLGVVGAAAILGGKMQWKKKKIEAFQKKIKEAYDKMIMNKEKLSKYAHNLISTLAKIRSEFVKDVLDILPQKWNDLHKILIAIESLQGKNRPHYQELLSKWQDLHGKLSVMVLQCMRHRFTSDDVDWPQSKPPVVVGSFGEVYKVTNPEVGESALKVMRDDITQQTACDLRKEIDICRYPIMVVVVTTVVLSNVYVKFFFGRQCKHENIVKFYGSVQLSSHPLKIGLLYEWCERGTLASFIRDDKEEPAYTITGFPIAQSFVLDMLSGIGYLHGNGIIHRDLKPENVLVSNQYIIVNSLIIVSAVCIFR